MCHFWDVFIGAKCEFRKNCSLDLWPLALLFTVMFCFGKIKLNSFTFSSKLKLPWNFFLRDKCLWFEDYTKWSFLVLELFYFIVLYFQLISIYITLPLFSQRVNLQTVNTLLLFFHHFVSCGSEASSWRDCGNVIFGDNLEATDSLLWVASIIWTC